MSNTITVLTPALLALLRDVHKAASSDSGLPFLTGVQLHTTTDRDGRRILVASATDRFRLLHGSTPVEDLLPARVYLNGAQVKQLLSLLRPYSARKRSAVAQTEIKVADGRVTVRQVTLDGFGDLTVSFEHDSCTDHPDIAKLLTKSLHRDDADKAGGVFHVDPARLGTFAAIAAARNVPLRVQPTGGPRAPVIVQIGDDLLGMLMPYRVDEVRPVDLAIHPVPLVEPDRGAA